MTRFWASCSIRLLGGSWAPYRLSLGPLRKGEQAHMRCGIWLGLAGQTLDAKAPMLGLGDAAPWPAWGGDVDRVGEMLALWLKPGGPLAPRMVHIEPAQHGSASLALRAAVAPEHCWDALDPEAAFAIESALWMLWAQAVGEPPAAGLGDDGDFASHMPTHILVKDAGEAAKVKACWLDDAGDAMHTPLRLKLKAATQKPWKSQLEHILKVLAAAGPHAKLRIDANGGWLEKDALAIGEGLVSAGVAGQIDWLEQPLAVGQMQRCQALRTRLGLRLALDEEIRNVADLQRAYRHKALDVVVLKPMFLGLHTTCILMRQAQALGVGVALTHSLESHVGRWMTLHLASAYAPALEVGGLGGELCATGAWPDKAWLDACQAACGVESSFLPIDFMAQDADAQKAPVGHIAVPMTGFAYAPRPTSGDRG